jgi:hypothetical protein
MTLRGDAFRLSFAQSSLSLMRMTSCSFQLFTLIRQLLATALHITQELSDDELGYRGDFLE